MIRIILNTVLSIILLATTSGYTISRHYCSGELVSVSISTQHDNCCSDNTCCKDETEFLQLKTDFTIPSLLSQISVFFDIDIEFFNNILFSIVHATDYSNNSIIAYSDSLSPPAIHTRLSKHQSFLL